MRNKIKQLLKKEGGFTLVELLGVIVILGLIVGISIPLIGNVIDGAEEDTIDAQKELVMDAAQMYELQGGTLPVDTDKLITDGFLEEQEDDAPVYTVTKTGKQYEIAAKK
ncbi:competence type IV pilus major pilin ComGC [Trichococcus pasteurii]|uniref:Bacterial general secretion pathway protein g-type pilin n=1 Tax=Trichococcus pasteurii TaxID=43064 RepID=A0A1W1IGJ5_9LACT|nr:prepilin-type N-terminal cleavage/methylation domain-containing protein [Trichococcus pasteurii]SFE63428.1 Competence protein ComGC [Trichococcus pasteurii]SLM52135.1 bacterial general secretion pathway protein g-type pilin [Trichococcus pasteurii]SSB93016.1 bacterial general secretion pathway protein g-type pilin [Trichococcus pasteurii]